MADLRERVIKALRTAELWRDMDGIGTLGTYGAEEDDYAKLADAAIAAVLDALEEPSSVMLDRFVSRALCVSIHGEGSWSAYGRNQWQTMLAAFREEQGV